MRSNLQKYESTNPVLQLLIRRFQRRLCGLLRPLPFESILDVGCGEGFLSRALLDAFPGKRLTGVDLSGEAIAAARARCPEGEFRVGAVEDLAEVSEKFDLVVCSEVLEHLPDPQSALTVLRERARAHVLLTVPWEPWFQLANLARGKYLRRLGNHPEHIQRWSLAGFVRLTAPVFETIHAETCFPWSIYLGRV